MKRYKVGDVIPKCDRNKGASHGLEHPYLDGSIGRQYLVWNRHSGKVRYVTAQRPNEHWSGFAEMRADKVSERMNAKRAGYKNGRLPVDTAAIDSTP